MAKVHLIDPDPGPDSAERHARTVPVLALYGLPQLVRAGSTIDVPDDVAGAGPHWRPLKDTDDQRYLRDVAGMLTFNDDGSIKAVHDLGHGLLAQPEIWSRPVEAETKQDKGGDK